MQSSVSAIGCVYFIQAGGPDGPVKIGHTVGDPYRRMATLQTGHHERLRMITFLPGSREDEQYFHGMLEEQRLHGEWFRFSSRVGAFIRMDVLDSFDSNDQTQIGDAHDFSPPEFA